MNKVNISALRALITFTCLFFVIILTHAQNKTFTIHGQIVTGDDSVAVRGAVIQIAGTKFRDTANADGFYKITKLPAGTSTFTITAPNYEKWSGTLVIKTNQKVDFRINKLPSIEPPDDPKPVVTTDSIPADQGLKIFEEPSDKKKKKKKKDDDDEIKDKEKKDKEKADNKEKPKKKTREELIADEVARKAVYEKLIEDVVAFENIYFSSFDPQKNTVTTKGFFSIESKQIYSFTAVFSWTGETCKLQNILVELAATK